MKAISCLSTTCLSTTLLFAGLGAEHAAASGTIRVVAELGAVRVHGSVGMKFGRRSDGGAAQRENNRRIAHAKSLVSHLSKLLWPAVRKLGLRLARFEKGFQHDRNSDDSKFRPAVEESGVQSFLADKKRAKKACYYVIRGDEHRVVIALRHLPAQAKRKKLRARVLKLLVDEPLARDLASSKTAGDAAELLYERAKKGDDISGLLKRLKKKRSRAVRGMFLHVALQRQDVKFARALIARKVGINHVNKERYHDVPLHLAAEKGLIELTKDLVKSGAKVDTKNELDRTPLFSAIRAGHSAVATFLIERGADVHYMSQKYWSPLHAAAARGDVKLVKLLLAKKADPLARKDKDRSPLDVAKTAAIKKLLQAAAKAVKTGNK